MLISGFFLPGGKVGRPYPLRVYTPALPSALTLLEIAGPQW
jgi:hypothetical protein